MVKFPQLFNNKPSSFLYGDSSTLPMPSLCHDLSSHYAQLRTLTDAFTTQYERVRESGDLTEVRRLKIQLEEARESLLEQLFIFRVPDAINCYHEALLEAGLDTTETQERQEMIIDIRQEIRKQLAVYREAQDAGGKPLLQEWIADISENEGLIFAEVLKDGAKIIERIKEGMIPLVMPSRTVQGRTWKVALTSLKPVLFKDGAKKAVDYLYLDHRYESEKMDQSGFFKDIPDRPYLVWVKPTLEPHPFTLNKAFNDQQAYYAQLITEHPDLYDRTDILPIEYIVLQTIFTSAIKEHHQDTKGATSEPKKITPLDCDGFTRFLSVGVFFDGLVPRAYFNLVNRRVGFGYDSGATGVNGFRPAART